MGSFRPFALGLLVLGFVVTFSEGDKPSRLSLIPMDNHGKSDKVGSGPGQNTQVSGDIVKHSTEVEGFVDENEDDYYDEESDSPLIELFTRTRRADRGLKGEKGRRKGGYRDGKISDRRRIKNGSHRGRKFGGNRNDNGGGKRGGRRGGYWSRKNNNYSHGRGKGGTRQGGRLDRTGNKWHGGNGGRHRFKKKKYLER